MKTILLVFFLTGLALQAQTPPANATTNPAAMLQQQARSRALAARLAAGLTNNPAATPGAARPLTRAVPAAGAPNGPAATGAAAGAPGAPAAAPAANPADPVAIIPPSSAKAAVPEEVIPQGMIDLRGADLKQVLQLYADLVNRTILQAANLNAAQQITLSTRGALTRSEAIQALDTVLMMNGVAMVNMGDKFVKAGPVATAGQFGAEFSKEDATNLPTMGKYVTHVVQLMYAKPTEMVQVLTPFASAIANPVIAIDSSQILVLRDATENVKRMLEMIKKIDVAVASDFIEEVIPIKYALASDIASALNSLSSGGGGTSVGSGGGTGRTSVSSRAGGAGGFGRTGVGGGMYPGQQNPSGSPFGAQGVTTPGATPGAAGSSFTSRLQSIIQKASASGEIQVIGQTKIIADERTNSLLIFASKEDMHTIRDIIGKLDVVLAQVLIEAVIIQVSLNDSKSLGLSYMENQPHGLGNYFSGLGAINNGNSLSGSPLVSGATNIANNSLPGGFSYLGNFGNDLSVTLTALAANSRAKILQRPRIQTSHAVPATLFVGESRPYPTSSYYGGGAYGGYSSIQQMQIGVTLEVTPLINPDGLVVMDIHQKIDSVSGTVSIANVGDVPITSSKEAQAKVAVRDHDTIMLGGLIETDKNDNNSGVPYLKDIPLLGYLFRSSSKTEARNELIVLIRPTVLPTPEIAALTATAEKNKMPGVRRAEKEIMDEETSRGKATDKLFQREESRHPEIMDDTAPVTPQAKVPKKQKPEPQFAPLPTE